LVVICSVSTYKVVKLVPRCYGLVVICSVSTYKVVKLVPRCYGLVVICSVSTYKVVKLVPRCYGLVVICSVSTYKAVKLVPRCYGLVVICSVSTYKAVKLVLRCYGLVVICSVSTYKAVKLVPRPWKTPEGTVNHVSLKTLLTGVVMHIMENPGITRDALVQKYAKCLQPVPLFELTEVIFCLPSSESRLNLVKAEIVNETITSIRFCT